MAGLETAIVGALTKALIPIGLSKVEEANTSFNHFCKNKFIPYIARGYTQLDKSTSQLFRNRNYLVSKLYEPLTLSSHSSEQSAVVDKYPSDLFNAHSKIIINDDAGMGKSTVLKMLYRYAVESSQIIPFYIDIKSLIKKDKVQTIQEYITSTNPDFSDQLSINFLNNEFITKPYLFLLDGADEVSDNMKSEVFEKIRMFTENAKYCKFVVATRNEDKILSAFNDFISFKIEPLEIEQAYSLLRKYQFGGSKADLLIAEIEKKENRAVKEFLANPLLTSLLYTAYEHSKTIPLKKSSFFSQIYRSLYENHDATKIGYLTRDKLSGLDIDDFSTILSYLAFLGRKVEKLEYEEDELISDLKLIKETHPTIDFDVRGFLTDIITRVPLFRYEGLSYRWQHKSIQEFFFLNYILNIDDKDEKCSAVRSLSTSKNAQKYKLVLDILYDKNQVLFHDVLTRNLSKILANNCEPFGAHPQSDTISVFYKYFDGLANVLASERAVKKATSPNRKDVPGLHVGVDFEVLYDGLAKKHDIADFIATRSSFLHKKSPRYRVILQRPEAVILEILHSKKHDFVELLSVEDKGYMSDAHMSKKEISLANGAASYIGMGFDFYIPNYVGIRSFLEDFDDKAKIKNLNTGFSLEGF
ncbi:NACHT domain-containing protein [Vibrio chagasii]|nr:NACHT domain-containing protein [Vibrio chagasii]CAH7082160.1 NACHT domain-containing protein [Vibrio chagasii]CAH7119339.1 NACHT domain-containing protein [Vibrio chagasii]CAH7273973.1 NACHT domain-containing protein [Vibrio chagasii]CAH7302065.1 NACHT domain-containing protein [Vibrio chagasii]